MIVKTLSSYLFVLLIYGVAISARGLWCERIVQSSSPSHRNSSKGHSRTGGCKKIKIKLKSITKNIHTTKFKQINMPYLDLEWTKHKTEHRVQTWELLRSTKIEKDRN